MERDISPSTGSPVPVEVGVGFGGYGTGYGLRGEHDANPPRTPPRWWPTILLGTVTGFLLTLGYWVVLYHSSCARGEYGLHCGILPWRDAALLAATWASPGAVIGTILGVGVAWARRRAARRVNA